MKTRALVVDDDKEMAETIRDLLATEGIEARIAHNADKALASLREGPVDLVVLDVGLPGFSGVQLCQQLKRQEDTAGVPVMMVTSMSRERDKVQGLDSGADDYVTKPFSAAEFKARVRALLRRSQCGGGQDRVWTSREITLNEDTRTVLVRGKEVELRPKEFDLLAALLKKKGRVLSRAYLGEAVWGPQAMATSHTINVCVAGLREKLGPVGARIIAVTGVGYKFEEE